MKDRPGRPRLPFAGQFSQRQVDLIDLLQFAHTHPGNREAQNAYISQRFFSHVAPGQQAKMGYNTMLAMRSYGLLDESWRPTALADAMLGAPAEAEAYRLFARHILVTLNGVEFLRTIRSLRERGDDVNLETLARELRARGIDLPWGGMHMSGMRSWLAAAGIFRADRRDFIIDEAEVERILGADATTTENLAALTPEQSKFLVALARLDPETAVPWRSVAKYATELYGIAFSEKSFPKTVLARLEGEGLIRATKTTSGRGAKPYLVELTQRARIEQIEPLVEALSTTTLLPPEGVRRPFAEILTDLRDSDRMVKGRALEYLAVRIARLLDLEFVGWRLRSDQTGGAEVDVLVEGSRLIFTRWQVQCKNTAGVSLDDVAKEVGLTFSLMSNVVLVIGTGRVSRDARNYAQTVMKASNLNIILLDGSDLDRVSNDPALITDILNEKARDVMALKRVT